MHEQPMEANQKSVAPPPSDSVAARIDAGDVVFGEKLLVLGRGPLKVRNASEAVFALDATGRLVLVVVVPSLAPGAGAEIADELDRLAHVTPVQLKGSASDESNEHDEIAEAHAKFFGQSGGHRPELNRDQHAVVVVDEEPDIAAWEELVVELGSQLAGVFVRRDTEIVPLAIPDELRRRETAGPLVTRGTLVLFGIVLLAVAVVLVMRARGPAETASVNVAPASSAVRDVAAGVPGGATHNQWIGQDHLVRARDGTLIAVFASAQGLQIVADQGNVGRSWGAPTTIAGSGVVSSSVAIDEEDRLHVAFADGTRAAYAVIERSGDGWTSGPVVELDPATKTPYVDVAYDDGGNVAHAVWVEETPGGQAPRWAAISGEGSAARVVGTRRLAPAANEIPVLVNVAAGGRGTVVATYRRGDSPLGWFARALPDGDKGFAWGSQERVRTEEGMGAADVEIDRSGAAHLVLRDSTTYALLYFMRTPEGAWSRGETAVEAESIEEIDFPSLTLDATSRLRYLFFQNDRVQPQTGVQVAVRDPSGSWETPFSAAASDAIPDGAFFPSSISRAVGAPIVLWTKGGAVPVLQAGVVVP